MFSDHLQKVDTAPQTTLMVVAGVLVIACQLVAMVWVTNGQVHKAAVRDAHYASQRVAAAECVGSHVGAARQSCLQQVWADGSYADGAYAGTHQEAYEANQQALADTGNAPASQMTTPQMQGLLPASFTPR